MAQHSKKRKKISRRKRQQTALRAPQKSTSEEPAVTPAAPAPTPVAVTSPPDSADPSSTPPRKVTAAFTSTTRRGPDGIDSELAAMEYPAVRADLRRLGLTLLVFLLLLAGLSILGNSTNVVNQLGHNIFRLWQ